MPAGTGDNGPDVAFGGSSQPTTWGPGSETLLPPVEPVAVNTRTELLFERIKSIVVSLRESLGQTGGRKEAK